MTTPTQVERDIRELEIKLEKLAKIVMRLGEKLDAADVDLCTANHANMRDRIREAELRIVKLEGGTL